MVVKASPSADTPLQLITSYLEQAQSTTSSSEKDEFIAAALKIAARLDDYLTETTTPASSGLTSMIDSTMAQDWDALHAEGKTKYHYTSNFCAGTFEAQFVATLCRLVQAKEVLEIGMFTGTTAAAMAQAIPDDGLVTTCEIEPWLASFAQSHFDRVGVSGKVKVELGSAHETLPRLAREGKVFDLIFLDAEKTGYSAYYDAVMEHGLLAPSGAFIVDNTLFKGHVFTDHESDDNTTALKQFNLKIKNDDRVDQIILPVRDGVSVITHRRPTSGDPVYTGHLGNSILQRFRLSGKSALVTGGGMGLGRCYAHALGEAGASVCVADLNVDAARAVVSELERKGVRAIAVRADVSSKEDCEAMVDAAVSAFGKLDIAVNNAGINLSSAAEDTPETEWDATMAVNAKGVFLSCQAEGRHMLSRPSTTGCSIINVASMSAVAVPHPQKQMVYNVSKAAVKKMTETLAVEWGGRGVRVNAIAPGIVETDLITLNPALAPLLSTWLTQIPLNRLASFADCAPTIIYLASDASAYVNGTIALIDGGQRFG
ncbi:hypothetical protein PYCC9005_001667 [Savitreella phatthalungensis]